MGNAFTKQYLTELINSRLAELGTPEGVWTEDEKRLIKLRHENAKLRGAELAQRTEKRLDRLDEALAAHNAERNSATLRELDAAISHLAYMRTEDSEHSNEIRELEQRINKQRANSPKNIDGEKARLERVKKYIEESPENEFSLTLMRSLGFIDIIKQAING